ncbi:MAG TPA: methylated-DNA--[protein]-cysteine S-methyltransferase [Gemmatimonadales bacterium]|nr:methylated-DNA--[protein]-cysteine S-methyltransferase [Gemmatimonadales bacterium]
MDIAWTSWRSPLGLLTLVEGETGPLVIDLAAHAAQGGWRERLSARHPTLRVRMGRCHVTREWLEAYFAGHQPAAPDTGHLAEAWGATAPQLEVWRAIGEIPFGEVRAYDDLAASTGIHPRQVGQAAGANPLLLLIPCHRVVGKQGDLGGYAGGLAAKQWLLDHELRSAGLVLRGG